nr:G patch domain and ankyrin repeat-containing protein 1 homolog [Ipomoea batatas]
MGLDGYEGVAAPMTATGLGAGAMDDHYSRSSSSMAASTSIPINSSNIGFQLLKKHGWKEGTGLGIAEQGRLEPVEGCVKRNKRGLGADKGKKASEHTKSEKAGKEVKLPVKKKTKAVSKKMKKILEFEKQLQEKELVREFYREFWPDNV